ncbi:MAG: CoA transferase, partial [Novosphingobium sp.]
SSLWAGPLASHLLWLAGARVVKVESRSRPDAMRDGDAVLFDLLNQGKASVQADFASVADREALVALLERADIVIEASRPRALRQLGIAAETILSRRPGQVWLTITGHGAQGSPADWVGFGDDCGVAGGLSKALADVTGRPGFVGDAIADPLTGITAALAGWRQWQSGAGARLGIAMRGVVAKALHEEQSHDHVALEDELTGWGAAEGRPFPAVAMRRPMAAVHGLGTDTREWLATC